ncbi:MAG: hypothetical protein AAB508_06950 [Patescibacteria group bacterium]
MTHKLKNIIVLGCIVLIAVFLRVWDLGNTPPSPDWDETALGYNAYSILKTGRDEYGNFLPLTIRSFDDYKPPLYVYVAIPFVAFLGLDTWVVRLPSVVAGVLAVIGTFLLVQELLRYDILRFDRKKTFKVLRVFWEKLPFVSAFLLALSPWHIQFSRIAFEANLGVTLNIFGVYFFVRGMKSKLFLSLSAVAFGLALYAYHSERLFVPLLGVILFIIFFRDIKKMGVSFLLFIVVGFAVTAPLIPIFTDKTTLTRLQGTSALADQTGLLARSVGKIEDDLHAGNTLGQIFDNRRIVWLQTVAGGYLSHFSLRWLFITGDNQRHHAPGMGLLYLFELPFLLIGLYWTARRPSILRSLLLPWFFVAPIAASVTTELPHAIRTLVFLPTFQVFVAVGLLESYEYIYRFSKVLRYMLSGTFVLLFALNILFFLHMYFVHMNSEYSASWQYGYKEAVQYTKDNYDRYDKFVVSIKLEQPHMFFLYFLKYPPEEYLKAGGTKSGGFKENQNSFGKYEFREIHWDSEIKDGKTLYIGTPKEISSGIEIIRYLDSKSAFVVADR